MQLKLSFKMLVVFLTTAVCSLILVTVSNRTFSSWNHEVHVQEKLDQYVIALADALGGEYSRNQGWQFLTEFPTQWDLLVQSDTESGDPQFSAVTSNTDLLARIRNLVDGIYLDNQEELVIPPHSISLFDGRQKLIAGEPGEFSELKKIQINFAGKPVGWLGIDYEKATPQPDKKSVQKLSIMFNSIAGVIFLISTVAVFLFSSRHLITPIKDLSVAMKALTDRNFDIRIPVKRKDELGILAERFNTMARTLQEYERNQKQWMSDISHELRTPLSILIGEIDAFQDGILKPDKASLAALGDEAKCLRRIVEDLHFISMAESGAVSMEKTTFKPLPVLTQVICLFEKRLKKNNMSIDVALEPQAADLEMTGDRVRLKQVFSNIMENALRHTDKPGRLTIRQHHGDGGLTIIFEDSGPGVPEQSLPHLFERLYRADSSRNRKTGGSGLGLAICKTILHDHQGSISAKASRQGGLRIEISLPILKPAPGGEAAVRTGAPC